MQVRAARRSRPSGSIRSTCRLRRRRRCRCTARARGRSSTAALRDDRARRIAVGVGGLAGAAQRIRDAQVDEDPLVVVVRRLPVVVALEAAGVDAQVVEQRQRRRCDGAAEVGEEVPVERLGDRAVVILLRRRGPRSIRRAPSADRGTPTGTLAFTFCDRVAKCATSASLPAFFASAAMSQKPRAAASVVNA